MRTGIYMFSVFLLFSCSKRLSVAEYTKFEAEHPDHFNVTTGVSPEFTLTYVTPEKLVVENTGEMTIEDLQAEYAQMKEQEISLFDLEVKRAGNFIDERIASKSEQMEFFSTQFKNEIKAVTIMNDTLTCSNFIFQAGAGFGNKGYFEFEFPEAIDQLTKIYCHSPYWGDSTIEFNLQQFQREYPSLKIK